jgi:uncharacterized protein
MPENPDQQDGPSFECKCCGLCCKRDPYYAVSLLDIRNISLAMKLTATDFFNRFCDVVVTPGGFRYSVILAPDGCPFLKDKLCGIHFFKPIGCWVFPESSLLPVRDLKKHVNAIPTCGILEMEDDDRPLAADHVLLAARDIHFEHTKDYFEKHEGFDEPSYLSAADRLINALADAEELGRRADRIREIAESSLKCSK